MHNFIVDFREEHAIPAADNAVDNGIFDEDCRRFLATQSGVGVFGVMVERKKFAGKQKELQLTEVGRSTTNSNLLKKVDRSGTGYGTTFVRKMGYDHQQIDIGTTTKFLRINYF